MLDDAHDPEAGRVVLLVLCFVVLGMALIAMVASATSVHLAHLRLTHLAEELALDAASCGNYLVGNLILTDADVEEAVTSHLAALRLRAAGANAVVVHAGTSDGRTATVTLRTDYVPPLLAWFSRAAPAGVTLTATASSRALVPVP